MDDFVVPQQVAQNDSAPRYVVPERPLQPDKGWHRFGSPAMQRRSNRDPQPVPIALADSTAVASAPVVGAEDITSGRMIQAASTSVGAWPANVTVFALSDGAVIPVQDYWRDGDLLVYALTSGEQGNVGLNKVDWSATSRLNWPRGIRVSLHGAPAKEE
jgi:hypothetical protein